MGRYENGVAAASAAAETKRPFGLSHRLTRSCSLSLTQTTRRNAEIKKRAKLEAKLAELGLTEEEYNAQEAAKKALPRNTTVSNEVRAKISAALKVKVVKFQQGRAKVGHGRPGHLPIPTTSTYPTRRDGETPSTETK